MLSVGYAECRDLYSVMLNAIMLSVIMLYVTMLSVVMLNVEAPAIAHKLPSSKAMEGCLCLTKEY